MQSFYLNNIADKLWYGKILFFLLLYLTWGVVQCEHGVFVQHDCWFLLPLLYYSRQCWSYRWLRQKSTPTTTFYWCTTLKAISTDIVTATWLSSNLTEIKGWSTNTVSSLAYIETFKFWHFQISLVWKVLQLLFVNFNSKICKSLLALGHKYELAQAKGGLW